MRILYLDIDTLRADHLGCYGYRAIETPVIDRLAAEGVRFAQAISPVPLTLPSHSTMLTGLDPMRHGVRNNGTFKLDESFTTLAEILAGEGYRTGLFMFGPDAFPEEFRYARRLFSFQGPRRHAQGLLPVHLRHTKGW